MKLLRYEIGCICGKLFGACATLEHSMQLAEWHGERHGHWGRIVISDHETGSWYHVYNGTLVRTDHPTYSEASVASAVRRLEGQRPDVWSSRRESRNGHTTASRAHARPAA